MARALLHRLSLVFLDEPTAGLDVEASVAVRDDLETLAARDGVTVFLTTHNMTEAEKLCDQIAVIRQGKLGLAIGYGWGLTLMLLLVSLVVVNVLNWEGQLLFFSPFIALANVALSLLMSGFVANLSVLISLRYATAQGAQQALMAVLMIPLVVLQLIPATLLSVIPNGRAILKNFLETTNFMQLMLIVLGVLAIINLGLLFAVLARFKRARLILD